MSSVWKKIRVRKEKMLVQLGIVFIVCILGGSVKVGDVLASCIPACEFFNDGSSCVCSPPTTPGDVCNYVCEGGSGGCFPAGTEVLVGGEEESVNIEDVEVGDRVMSQDQAGKRQVSVVAGLDQPISTNMCEITYTDGDTLQLTDNHAMSTTEGWKAINPEAARAEVPSLVVAQLEEGDEIKKADGGVATVVSYACWSEKQQTYNLKLEGSVNTYFADGYLAHNKKVDVPGCPVGYYYDGCATAPIQCVTVGESCGWNVRGKYSCSDIDRCTPHCAAGCVKLACTDTSWSTCTATCGGGTETSNCGTERACNTTACVVTGTVYYDPNNTCSTSTPQNVGGRLTATMRGTAYSSSVSSGGTYSIAAPGTTYARLDLGGLPAGYACSTGCLQGCPTATSVVSPSTGNNFFLTDNADAWWQTVGAGVYAGGLAGGVTVESDLPSSSTRLVIPGTNDLAAVVRASGTVGVGAGEISDNNWSVISPYNGKTLDYRYFASRMGVTPGTTSDFSSGTIGESEIAGLGQEFYYTEDAGDGEVSLGSAWSVGSGESYVIFVDGDLLINQDITVDSGGFLAFIVNGGVTVEASVTSIQGIYLMDEIFSTQTLDPVDDAQLVTEGMVVAWGGVSLNRYLGGLTNRTVPAEQFVYRPDLLVNMPAKLKSFALTWQEVVPGTFD
jgi:hypothetical protein